MSDPSIDALDLNIPWYKDSVNPHPFTLIKKIQSNSPNAPPLRTLAFFPWKKSSLATLWKGSLNSSDILPGWIEMVSQWSDAIAVGGTNRLYILYTQRPKKPLSIKLPDDPPGTKRLPTDVLNVAWALSPNTPLEPFVVFSNSSLLYVLNVKTCNIVSYLRGHGGPITSIAVHPISVHLFCTTSQDFSTRIYDLTLTPQQKPMNEHWFPETRPSRSGAAHGLHMTEIEGSGLGRCIAVLMGGRSGGHQAAVLGAAFHPRLPVIATCGLDRLVKIWYLFPTSKEMLTREDKPLFSSGRVHKARVLSITWLPQHDDVLLTHSAPALLRKRPNIEDSKETYLEPGTLVIWRWLGIDRFFPPGQPEDLHQDVLRGCASDYQESASFKLISTSSFPAVPTQYITPNLQVYQSSTHDPLVLFTYPKSTSIHMINVAHLAPRKPPPFPWDETAMVELTKNMTLVGEGDDDDDDDEEDGEMGRRIPESDRHPQIAGWEVKLETNLTVRGYDEKLEACAMGMDGKMIVGVGSRGSLWIWAEKPTGP